MLKEDKSEMSLELKKSHNGNHDVVYINHT